MDERVAAGLATPLVVASMLAGCGGSGGDRPEKRQGGQRASARAPVFPTCGTDGFGAPRVTRLPAPGVRGAVWSLRYVSRRSSDTVLVVEFPASAPSPPRGGPGAREVMFGKRRVLYRGPTRTTRVGTAQWRTSRALYSIIATDQRALRRFIACLP